MYLKTFKVFVQSDDVASRNHRQNEEFEEELDEMVNHFLNETGAKVIKADSSFVTYKEPYGEKDWHCKHRTFLITHLTYEL